MKKYILFISTIAMMLSSCADKNAFKVTSQAPEGIEDGTSVYLKELGDDMKTYSVIDSSVVKDGTFELKGIAKEPLHQGTIVYGDAENKKNTFVFILEPGDITIAKEDGKIAGGVANDSYQIYNNKITSLTKLGKEISNRLGELKDPADVKDEEARLDEIEKEVLAVIKSYVTGNIASQAGTLALLTKSYAFDLEELQELLPKIPVAFKDADRVLSLEKRVKALTATKVGSKFTDLKGNTPDGKEIALSDFVGKNKVVLVDFWASWCPPCRKEMPEIVDIYKDYRKKGLEIVGVSLDKEQEAWVAGIKALNITWVQMSDLKYWQSDLSAAYGVNSIPHTVLINQDGEIIARGLHPSEIRAKLEKILK